jgi:hypothetical protein
MEASRVHATARSGWRQDAWVVLRVLPAPQHACMRVCEKMQSGSDFVGTNGWRRAEMRKWPAAGSLASSSVC